MGKRKNKYFTASDCIHLHACRKVTAIANRVIYGLKGTQKIARGCSKECPCYCSAEELEEYVSNALSSIHDAKSTLSCHYDEFNTTDDYYHIQGELDSAVDDMDSVGEFLDGIHDKRASDELD